MDFQTLEWLFVYDCALMLQNVWLCLSICVCSCVSRYSARMQREKTRWREAILDFQIVICHFTNTLTPPLFVKFQCINVYQVSRDQYTNLYHIQFANVCASSMYSTLKFALFVTILNFNVKFFGIFLEINRLSWNRLIGLFSCPREVFEIPICHMFVLWWQVIL